MGESCSVFQRRGPRACPPPPSTRYASDQTGIQTFYQILRIPHYLDIRMVFHEVVELEKGLLNTRLPCLLDDRVIPANRLREIWKYELWE